MSPFCDPWRRSEPDNGPGDGETADAATVAVPHDMSRVTDSYQTPRGKSPGTAKTP